MVKRILTIDGGATQVGFAASFLSAIEDTERLRIADYFDIVAGTGGGGVLAIALGLDVPARTLVGWGALDSVPAAGAFDSGTVGRARWQEFCRIRKGTLTEVFKDREYGDSSTRLIVPGLDSATGAITVFDSEGPEDGVPLPAALVALATLSVPTFEALAGNNATAGSTFECAVANNPVDIALSRALQTWGPVGTDLKILSIGCRREPATARPGASDANHALIRSQSDFALDTARTLAGPANVLRVEIAQDRAAMPDQWQVVEVGETEAGRLMPLLKASFLSKPIKRPYRDRSAKASKASNVVRLIA